MGLLDAVTALAGGDNHATLTNVSADPASDAGQPIHVQFNPTEVGLDTGVHYAEVNVPGLQRPLQQFVRGDASTLTIELLLDAYDARSTKSGPTTVWARLQRIRRFVTVDGELHAPPVCRFQWKDTQFVGVVTQLREKHTLFDEDGMLLRARLTLTFKEYVAPEVQLRDPPRRSPDRTRVRAVRERETLAQIANEAYGSPRLWRAIATANDVDRPRFVRPGTPLTIPAIP